METAWVASRDGRIHLTMMPARDPSGTVVFVPGITSNAEVYRSTIPGGDLLSALARESLNVVALDLQGHGRSEGRRGHVPFRSALANIGDAVGWAAQRFGAPIGLIGSSLGGILALYAAIEDTRVASVLCHNAADLRDVATLRRRLRQRVVIGLGETIRAVAERAPHMPMPVRALISPADLCEDPENVRRWRRRPDTVWWYSAASVASIFFTPEDKPAIEALDKPLLLATGDEDGIFAVGPQRDIVERVEGPAELWVLQGAGHGLPLEHLPAFAPRAGEWFRTTLSFYGPPS